MPKKLIKKYNDGGTSRTTNTPLTGNQATIDYAWLDSQVVSPAPINPAPPVVPQGIPSAPNPYDYGTAAYNGFEIYSRINNLSGEKLEKFNKSLDSRRGQSSINIGNMAKGMGVNMGASYLGGLLGNAFGGEVGNAVGAIASNFGSTVGNTLLNHSTLAGGLKNFTSFSNLGNLAGGIATGILDRSTAHQRTSGKYGTLAAGVDTASPLINTVFGTSNPYGMVGSVGMAAINKITGGTDGMTIADSLLGSSGVAGALFAANPLVGAGYMALSGINSATGQTTEKNLGNDFLSKEDLAELWGSYSKSNKDHRVASKYGGKKYGGISVLTGSFGRANDKVMADNQRINTLMNIHDNRELGQIRGQAMADINSLDYRLNTFGGYDLYGTRIGRKGMKLPTKLDIDRIKTILNSKKDIEQFKKGGQMNVIPEGALHARLHHLEGIDNITRKGIPVVDKSGELQAEIERNEIIFSLEVTNKLEQLRKDGSEKAAIAAGKLLVDEIFHNTDDRTGLIAEVIGLDEAKKSVFKEGGIIKAEEPIKKFQDGGILEEQNAIVAEEPLIGIDDEDVELFLFGGEFNPLNNPVLNNFIEESIRKNSEAATKIPTLEEYFDIKRGEISKEAVRNAVTRKLPYMMKNRNWMNCIATALDNYRHAKMPMTYSNVEFAANPGKYGFEAINKSGEDIDFTKLPFGVIVQDANNEEANLGNSDVFGHAVTFTGFDDKGNPLFDWSKGHSNAESVVHYGHYPFVYSKRKDGTTRGPVAYRVIGTPELIEQWTKEYYETYPKRHQKGGIIKAEKPSNEEEEIEEFKKGGKSKVVIPEFLTYDEENDKYIPNLLFTYDKTWYDSDLAKEFRKRYIKDEWKDDSGYHIEFVNKKNWRPRGVSSFNNARPYAIPESGYPEGWVYLPADGIMGRPEGEPGRYIGEDGGVYWYKDGGTVNNKKEKKTPKEILKILNNDPNFDDGFIDEPEQDDDLSFNSLPQTIKLKITEEEWKDFLFSVFSQNEMVMKKLNSIYHD